ncbi:plasma-membrane choline transporter family protein [Nitzschia inconspicua]|uniref:Choline transporter-like protein n=1 Tax=Nitzschia inconspicua TaxID=303405 RepID=A0A9K3LT19_9STRA|nr:plasma-membrane choline transporter family protein [Nitzschia inconspicua]
MDQSHSSQSYEAENSVPFFADMTLDLAEAHDIAETPEPMQRTILQTPQPTHSKEFPNLPSLDECNTIVSNPTDASADSTASTPQRIFIQPSSSLTSKPSPMQLEIQEIRATDSSPSFPPPTQYHNPQDDNIESSFVDRDMGRLSANPRVVRGPRSTQRRRRQWPKDVSWAMSFFIIVPVTLLFPIWFAAKNTDADAVWIATATSPRLATLHTIFWGLGVAILLSRLLYRTAGGGDGDDARHFASQLLLSSAPISVSVFIMLIVAIKVLTPHAFWPYAIIPAWYLARDLYLFRRWKMTATTPGGRQAFFQALACMTLDILSRSLRRNPLWRMIVGVVLVQFVVILLWRMSLLSAIQSQSPIWILMALMGGKWATGTVARFLSLIACGGISNWFAEQSSLVEEMNQMQQKKGASNRGFRDEDEQMIEFTDITSTNTGASNDNSVDMPEAYRTVDASAYKSVLQNEGMEDDDFEDEIIEDEEDGRFGVRPTVDFPTMSARQKQQRRTRHSRTTVKQFMMAGLSVNFGSIAKCGLLGGLAQLVWSQIRKIDHARAAFRRGSMQGMDIGGGPDDRFSRPASSVPGVFNKIMLQINFFAREFVRNHSDMAMSYVADYQLSYTRAAQDVALLLDEAGVEPIIHDDISTHMSACVGGSVSGLIVLLTGAVLTHQRNRNASHAPDSAIVLDMLMAFYFCYTLIFTVMEPLRASIKAVYVCFAQHPDSLSQAFPLIFHRLTRMSQSNLS